jgi:ceramide glucosyltransferase
MIANVLLFCAILGLITSTIYLLLVAIGAYRFPPAGGNAADLKHEPFPPVSILKPLRGLEPQLEQNLESFFVQDYPTFELIFVTRHRDDPVLQIIDSLRKKYPQVKTSVVFSGEPTYPNAKVFAVEQMAATASYPTYVISDSDARVAANCLQEVVGPLRDRSNGLVTCIYRGVPTGGFWSRLEALGMSVEMTSGVLVANLLEGMKFALGPVMAARKDVIDSLHGFAALKDYLADDFVLGRLTHNAGKKVVLSHHIIEHVVLYQSAHKSLLHQVRWMKSSRYSRPLGHLGTGLTFAIPFGMLGMAAGWMRGDGALAWTLLAWAALNRTILAWVAGWRVVRDRRSLDFCWLYPLRDILGFFVWCASFLGNTIVWRGERYRLSAGGRMERLSGPRGVPENEEQAALPRPQ